MKQKSTTTIGPSLGQGDDQGAGSGAQGAEQAPLLNVPPVPAATHNEDREQINVLAAYIGKRWADAPGIDMSQMTAKEVVGFAIGMLDDLAHPKLEQADVLNSAVAAVILERDDLKAKLEGMPEPGYVSGLERKNFELLATCDGLRADVRTLTEGQALGREASVLLFTSYARLVLRHPAFARCLDFATEPDGTRFSIGQRTGEMLLIRKPLFMANMQVESDLRSTRQEMGRITRKLAANGKQLVGVDDTLAAMNDTDGNLKQDAKTQAEIKRIRDLKTRTDRRRAQLQSEMAPLAAEESRLLALLEGAEPTEVRIKDDLSNVRVIVVPEED